jgi:hypothetical protein
MSGLNFATAKLELGKSKSKIKNVDNRTWSVDTISVQLDVPGVG